VHGEGWRHRLDLAYPGQMVAIELDGNESHLTDEAFEADPVRDNRLCLAGWDVLHYTAGTGRGRPVRSAVAAPRTLPHPWREGPEAPDAWTTCSCAR
jgi:hypothetical protein